MFSKEAIKINKIFIADLTVSTYCQIDGEDFVNFCDLLRKRELYLAEKMTNKFWNPVPGIVSKEIDFLRNPTPFEVSFEHKSNQIQFKQVFYQVFQIFPYVYFST